MNDFLISTDSLLLNFELNNICLLVLCLLLLSTTVKLIFSKTPLDNIIVMTIFSLLISLIYLFMDAPDVAMTEVALGACLSTCVLINFIQKIPGNFLASRVIPAAFLSCAIVAALGFICLDLPLYGASNAPIHTSISNYYLDNTPYIGIPSTVAAILASYRGFDTLGETSVILIAGLSVVLLLSHKNKRN